MGYREIELTMPVGYDERTLESRIRKELRIGSSDYHIVHKSLDARKKENIRWVMRAGVFSPELKGGLPPREPAIDIPRKKRNRRVVITGSGPAGFFAALVLQRAGFDTVILERGADVTARDAAIRKFETMGVFDGTANYAFGEGGAGTFSDGKLTSRSKNIPGEKRFIIDSYIRAGAPGEIAYLAYPHVGSDNLKIIVPALREEYRSLGGEIRFGTLLEELRVTEGRVTAAVTNRGILEAGLFVVAPGHSSYETYRMLMRQGVRFEAKNFALGFRAEHPQEIINLSQWGHATLPGVKAAEYRLTSNREGRPPVFTFCMCPGGMVVPATPYATSNIVNGMSLYRRDGRFANAACVAGVHPSLLTGHDTSASEALGWLEQLEQRFYDFSGGYKAPFCTIDGFLKQKESGCLPEGSYPLGMTEAPLWTLLPAPVIEALSDGLRDFNRKLKGYGEGILLGLESKTSSPIRAIRDGNGLCEGFTNLYIAGEGSGYAGGIISSGADGIRTALAIAGQDR